MRRFVTPTLQISIALLSLTISLILIAYSFGLVPSENNAALEARARISENLAVQLANLAGRNDAVAIKETIESITGRNSDVLSVAVRNADGKLLVESGSHDAHWLEPTDGKSTATHMLVPLRDADVPQGRIEIVFRPFDTKSIFGFPKTMMAFIGFVAIAGLAGYYFILKRSLRELDPGRAIPERVKAAFDTLAEGVLIMDEREYVLLANDAFVRNIYSIPGSLLGIDASELPWLLADGATPAPELPWRTAMRDEKPVLGIPIGIRDRLGDQRRLLANATRIVDGRGVVRGVIATFDDVTVLHQTNDQLHISIDQLNISQLKISEQNQQLQRLATSDPLTGCLNRRTFFAEAELELQNARNQNQRLCFLMLDADHFKSVNDRFGHVVGDQVLIGVVEVMKRTCREGDLVGRYGGEEFCIMVARSSEQDVEELADQLRQAIADVTTWLPNGERVTVSIGIALLTDVSCELAELVKRADEALYAAKASGRNRFVNWRNMPAQSRAPRLVRSAQSTQKGESPTRSLVLYESKAGQTPNDKSTGLLNREATLEYIEAMIRDNIAGLNFAIARIDIENLEYFSDRYGRDVGDALLAKISQRITSKFRRGDMLARLNADEFLLLLEPFESKQQIEPIVERIINELRQPFLIEGHELFCSCCIGVSIYPEHGSSYEVLQRNADNAMFRAKRSAKGEAVFFDFNMRQAATARMEAEQRLRLAVRARQFCCAFQLKVDINRRQAVGFEALVRWRDDDGAIHLPEEFIGLAVELGLIDQITNCVLDIAIKSIDRLDAVFGSGTTVSINVAATLANDLEFMLPFTRALRDSKLPNRIILELTEDSFIAKGAFQTVILPILRDIGVRVSIDDFGTGYSSLSALADITADEIKIDRSFISGIHQRPRNQSILRAISSLGHALNMTVVAEGVETFEELAYLQAATSIRHGRGFISPNRFTLKT
jgi:diguanylate cyclase (GGDEF)-like protein